MVKRGKRERRGSVQQGPCNEFRGKPASILDSPFDRAQCLAWFRQYANEAGTAVEPEGMEQLCKDIEVAPEDIVMLLLAFKLKAEKMCYFTIAEWMEGMESLRCDCLLKLKNKLDSLKSMLNDPDTFTEIYEYTFHFAKIPGQKSIEIGTAIEMLELLLGERWPLCSSLIEYLQQPKFKALSQDRWNMILQFSLVMDTDFSNYDENGEWPVILDEFVEWYRQQYPDSTISGKLEHCSIAD